MMLRAPPVVTTKDVPRHCPLSPEGKITLKWLKATILIQRGNKKKITNHAHVSQYKRTASCQNPRDTAKAVLRENYIALRASLLKKKRNLSTGIKKQVRKQTRSS